MVDRQECPSQLDRLQRLKQLNDKWFGALRPLCESGSVLAVLEGVNWCHEHEVAPPAWFLVAVARTIARLALGTDKKVGRAASGLNRERELLKRYMRWQLVNEAERGRDEYLHEQSLWPEYPGVRSGRHKRHVRTALDRLGRNQDDLFAYVSWQLEGTPLAGGPDAIKVSYQRVERDMRSPNKATEYYPFSLQAMEAAGMMDIIDPVPAKKWPAFYGWES